MLFVFWESFQQENVVNYHNADHSLPFIIATPSIWALSKSDKVMTCPLKTPSHVQKMVASLYNPVWLLNCQVQGWFYDGDRGSSDEGIS